MKVKLNIRDILADAWGDSAHNVRATIDIQDLFEFTSLKNGAELNLIELLEENRMIAHIWTIDDVHEIRTDLTDDQAWEVLKACFRDLDSRDGISWETIENAADKLFGQPVDRVVRFGDAIQDYADEDTQTNLVDLLTDSLHWSRGKSVDFDQALKAARMHFAVESNKGDRP